MEFITKVIELESDSEKENAFLGTAAIELESVGILPDKDRERYQDFVSQNLARQMDVIHSLYELATDFGMELRYLYDPEEPCRVRVYFLIQVRDTENNGAIKRVDEAGTFMINLLRVNNSFHKFTAVTDPELLDYLIVPFQFKHLAEIVRREDNIPLDSLKRKSERALGFNTGAAKENERGASENDSNIYYVYPYICQPDDMERLCNSLLMQRSPTFLSICLRPYQLSGVDEKKLEERTSLCEKYSQLKFGFDAFDPERLEPFLVKQANSLYFNCSKELTSLQDAAFLLKVQIASTHPIRREFITTAGTTITEHAGFPNDTPQQSGLALLNGGFDWHTPKTPEQEKTALENLIFMGFTPWIDTISGSEATHWRYMFDVRQANAAFRLPVPKASEFPGISTLQFRQKYAPTDLPSSGVLIGEHFHLHERKKVFSTVEDRLRHMYIVGQTGTGKSTLFLNMVFQDILNDRGVCVIDPHGELIDEVIKNIPKKRVKDVVFINPIDSEWPVGINLLESENTFDKDFCVNYLIDIFDALYDLSQTGGPLFEMYIRNALYLLLDQPGPFLPTVLDVPRIFQDRSFRRKLLENCVNPYVIRFWKQEAEKAGGDASISNLSPYITSKLGRFIYNETMRATLGQRRSTINFRKIMDSGKILLVDLRKGILGEMNSHFLGMIIVGKLLSAALSRTDTASKSSLKNFYLYVDEFQCVATDAFISILSEARKYRLSVTMTNQYISQIPEKILRGILGNVGTLASFRVGTRDAELLSREFGEVVSRADLMGLSNWNAYLRLLINGKVRSPFNIQTILPAFQPDLAIKNQIIQSSREQYARKKEDVEKEIREAWS